VHYKINLITMRMANHAKVSGYDRLADFLGARVIYPVTNWTFGKRAVCRILRFLINRSDSTWYHRDQFYSELSAARQWFRKNGQIFHFLYGENSYRYLGILKSMPDNNNSIVCTYHTPPDKFCQVVHDREHIKRLDAVIVVSRSQQEFFVDLLGPERVFYIPHGIDVDYFKPEVSKKNNMGCVQLLFVGNHLRDHKTLAESAKILNERCVDFRLAIVTSPKVHHYFEGIENIHLYSGIGDTELLDLYQQANIFVMPLIESTANNSLLEAMACGLPIISTDLPGVRDYVTKDCAALTPRSDSHALAEAILYMQQEPRRLQEIAQASRLQALNFSWQEISLKTRQVYEYLYD